MMMDEEILDTFADEVASLKPKLTAAVQALQNNINQPEEFMNFAQVIDGIYGTAMTLGFIEMGEYTGILREMCRKCGATHYPRAMTAVLKMMVRCLERFDELNASIKNPAKLIEINKQITTETTKAKILVKEIFEFSKS